jgi:thioredoxin 1
VAPFIEELAGDFAGKAKVGKVDTDSNRDTALKFGISAIPTVMIFKDGQVVKRFVGVQSKREYAAALNAAMK